MRLRRKKRQPIGWPASPKSVQSNSNPKLGAGGQRCATPARPATSGWLEANGGGGSEPSLGWPRESRTSDTPARSGAQESARGNLFLRTASLVFIASVVVASRPQPIESLAPSRPPVKFLRHEDNYNNGASSGEPEERRRQLEEVAIGEASNSSSSKSIADYVASLSQDNSAATATDSIKRVSQRIRRHAGQQQQPSVAKKHNINNPTQSGPPQAKTTRRPVIHATLKGQVALPCELQTPEVDDAVQLVLWYKDNSMVPIYSLDARASLIQEARHKPGAWLEGRSKLRIVPLAQHQQQQSKSASVLTSPETGRPRNRRQLGEDNVNYFDGGESHGGDNDSEQLMPDLRWRAQAASGSESSPHVFDKTMASKGAHFTSWRRHRRRRSRRNNNNNHADYLTDPRQPLVAQLYVDSLSSEDNGLYRCRVDFRRARSRFQEMELRIVVPAERPKIRDLTTTAASRRQQVQQPESHAHLPLVGPHDEGSRVVLECETQGGWPEPQLSWWRDGRLVDDSYEVLVDVLADEHLAADGSSRRVIERRAGAPDVQLGDSMDEFRLRAKLVGGGGGGQDEEANLHLAAPAEDDGAASGSASDTDHQSAATSRLAAGEHPTGPTQSSLTSQVASPPPPATTTSPIGQNRVIRNRLELASVGRADLLANYSCLAWNSRLGEPPASYVMIDMNLRPIKIQIENERLPVQADKPLEVTCRAHGSRPAALISWYRGAVKLTPQVTSGGKSAIGSASSSRRHSRLDGETTGGGGGNEARRLVQIQETISADSNVTSSTLTIVPQLDDGGQIITCKAENPFMSSSMEGAKLNAPVDGAEQPLDSTEQQQPPASQVATSAHIEDSWKLDVHYLPRVKLALGEKLNGNLREGNDVYFECSINAHPQAQDIRWWFEGRELEANVTSGVIISNQSLVLQRVNRTQRGRYTCSALNSVGESHSNSVHLRVQYAPFCRDPSALGGKSGSRVAPPGADSNGDLDVTLPAVSQLRHKTHYGAARLEPVKVYCHVDADPSDSLTYRWAFLAGSGAKSESGNKIDVDALNSEGKANQQQQQQLVYLSANSIQQPEAHAKNQLTSVATYTPRSELDYGTLLCWAQNSLGQQAEPCAYQVVPAERPDPVRNCRLLNASDTQLTVACEPGYDGGIDQSFYMEVYDSRRQELVANVSNAPVTLLSSQVNSIDLSGWLLTPKGLTANESRNSEPEGADEQQQNGSQSASLVSEQQNGGSRQQKQRHSMQPQSDAAASASSATGAIDLRQDAIFVTDRNLKPATDYFLSIYSANSKGPSEPVAFTATTATHQLGDLPLGSPSTGRDGRRADPSHLISDVLSLSWNPFLIVCAITIGLFVLFATVTFALMKYIDFSAANFTNNNHHRRHSSAGNGSSGASVGSKSNGQQRATTSSLAATMTATYAPCLSSAGSSSSGAGTNTTNRSAVNGADLNGSSLRRPENEYSIEVDDIAADQQQQQHQEADDEEEEITDAMALSRQVDNRRSKVGAGSRAPKTLTVAATGATSTGSDLPLNGMSATGNQKFPSILNGSYLRSKIQQLASGLSPQHLAQTSSRVAANQQQQQLHQYQVSTGCSSGLRQSTSDNFLNHLDAAGGCWPSGQISANEMSFLGQQQELLALSQQQAAYCAGTLPRNLPSHMNHNNNHQLYQQYNHQMPMQAFEANPYALRQAEVLAGFELDSTLMLAPAARPNNGTGVYMRHQPSGQPVEHLVISGKQYIHQTSGHLHRNSANRSSYAGAPSRFSGQAARHQLQVTSVAPAPPPSGLMRGSFAGDGANGSAAINHMQPMVSSGYIEGNPIGACYSVALSEVATNGGVQFNPLTSENYQQQHLGAGNNGEQVANLTAINNNGGNNATKTSDLGDDYEEEDDADLAAATTAATDQLTNQQLLVSQMSAHLAANIPPTSHAARLTLVGDCGDNFHVGGANGSPSSSGIAELELHQTLSHSGSSAASGHSSGLMALAANQQQMHYFPISSTTTTATTTTGSATQSVDSPASSTATVNGQQQQNNTSDALYATSQKSGASNSIAARIGNLRASATSQQTNKKSNVNQTFETSNCQTFQEQQQQYTMFVDGDNNNNNLPEFYVLEADQHQHQRQQQQQAGHPNKTRVRLVGAEAATGNGGAPAATTYTVQSNELGFTNLHTDV